MADLGNQLEGAAGGLERLTEGFDNLMVKISGVSTLEAQMIKEKQTVSKQLAKANKDKIREEKRALPLQKKMTIQLQQRLKNSTLLNKGLKETIKSMNLFGKTMSGMKKGLGTVGKGIAAIGKAGVIGGLVVGIKFLIDGLLKVDGAMAGMSKRLGVTRNELSKTRDVTTQVGMELGRWGITFEQVTAEAGNLAQQFGSLKYVTEDLVKTSFKLQQVYGVSAQAAGELLEALERTNKDSQEFLLNIGVKAQKEGVLTSLVMKDLASQSQMIAIQSSRGAESMQNLAIEAAKAGGSLKDFQGLESTYSSIESASAAIGEATTLMGSDIAKHMGNIQELRMMYERGETDKILERVQKATAATVKLNKEGNLVNMQGRELYRSELKAMSKLAGMEEGAYKLMATSHLKEVKHLAGLNAAQRKAYLEKKRQNAVTEQERLAQEEKENKIMRDRQTLMERLGNIAKGVMERITLAFSKALGIDQTGKGSINDQITKLEEKIETIFNFKDFNKNIKDAGGGLKGFLEAAKPIFKKIGDVLGDALMSALDRMLYHMGKNSMIAKLILGETRYEREQMMAGGIARGGSLGGSQVTNALDNIVQDATGGKFDVSTTRKGGTDRRLVDAMLALAESNEDVTLSTEDLADGFIALKSAGWDEFDKNTDKYILQQLEAGKTFSDAVDQLTKGEATVYDPTRGVVAPAKLQALGGVHRRGTAAIVGEAGGEVVASRSALRSGIGIGGRAASALAGIGVPGFYRGGMVEGVTGRKGLMTGFGSEASRGAQAAAFQKEQAIQQAAMVNYWREYYQNKLNNMGGKDQKKKDDLDWLKKFFNDNKKDIDTVAKILLKNQKPAAKEMYKGVFTAMTAWSSGTKTKDALKLGIRAGLTESMKKGGTVYNLFERSNEAIGKLINSQSKATAAMGIAVQSMSVGIQNAMATYAQTGDWGAAKEGMKRSAVSGGVTMLATKLLGKDAMNLAKTQMGIPAAAKGKYVNSPTLMMVGEEGRGEVVIPTERIRKGLPINAGVAAELGSIGVPGFKNGAKTEEAAVANMYANITPASAASNNVGTDAGSMYSDLPKPKGAYKIGDKDFAGGLKASGAMAALSFAQVYMQTGNMRLAAQAGLEAGISMGATALLSIPPSNPAIGMLLGPMVGKLTAGPAGRALGLTGGQGKGRNRVLKSIEGHVKSGGVFDFGSPGGMRKNISVAVGGKEGVPTQENYDKLVNKVGNSAVLKPLWQAGIDPSVLVAAGSGKLKGQKAFNSFAAINTALYGSAGGDKYMKAMAVPQLADGGIVTRPTTAVIGEAGPEMVIPLHEQKQTNDTMIKELKEQNKLMKEMIKTQIETGKTEVRLDGRVIAESTAENFYDIGNGI